MVCPNCKMEMISYEEDKAYGGFCPICVKNAINTEYDFADMQGDHIVPWSKGGHTVEDNLKMLCSRCNNEKSAK